MRKDKIAKVAGLNAGIAVADTVLFSPGLLGIELGGTSVLVTALGATAIFMTLLIFTFGNYRLLMDKVKIIQTSELQTAEDFIYVLKQISGKKTFEKDISVILEQIDRFQKKNESINDILLQKFSSTEMSYSRFKVAIEELGKIFFINIKSILNKLNAFDEVEYTDFLKANVQNKLSNELMNAKMKIYNEYISFIMKSIEDNEQIILKLDMLLLEISKFNSLEDGEIEKMSAMIEIDELIDKAKYYR